jgi:hypothetical protein
VIVDADDHIISPPWLGVRGQRCVHRENRMPQE